MSDTVQIGDCTLILGNCLEVMPQIGEVDHAIFDGPYEAFMHDAKNSGRTPNRTDKGADLKELDFASIDEIRDDVVRLCEPLTQGWFISFCTSEGVARWADAINASKMKYKRACVWIKPDSTPQLNGQGPAQGAEHFVTAWCGKGYAKWNAGGKRGVYTHFVNPPDRHGGHPTEKPWRLFAELMRDFTNPGDMILDPFMGSGTTLVAAAKTGRRAIGIEMNPKYFAMACDRVRDSYSQGDMFVAPPERAVQQDFAWGND